MKQANIEAMKKKVDETIEENRRLQDEVNGASIDLDIDEVIG
jgi:regulator of replication initiation timing